MTRPELGPFGAIVVRFGCDAKQVDEAARFANRAASANPDAELLYNLVGFDEDPRELWQIPEARIHLARFYDRLSVAAFALIDEMGRAALLVSAGYGRAEMVNGRVQFLVPSSLLRPPTGGGHVQ